MADRAPKAIQQDVKKLVEKNLLVQINDLDKEIMISIMEYFEVVLVEEGEYQENFERGEINLDFLQHKFGRLFDLSFYLYVEFQHFLTVYILHHNKHG